MPDHNRLVITSTYLNISIKLSDKTGEVIVLKIHGQKVPRKLGHFPDNEAVVITTPRYDRIGGRIVHHVEGFAQKRRHRVAVGCGVRTRGWYRTMKSLH